MFHVQLKQQTTMKTVTSISIGALLCSNLFAQGVITRQNAGQSYFYYNGDIQTVLDDADATAGVDTILLGGGAYDLNTDITPGDDLFIRSQVVLIGTGIHPDSSLAYNNNGRTEITGNQYSQVFFEPNASGSQVHGVTFANGVDVDFGPSDLASTNVDNVKFFRCLFTGYVALGNNQYGSQANDTYLHECVLAGSIDISHALNTIVRNSSIAGGIGNSGVGENTLIENCILFWPANANISGLQMEHNVFIINSGAPNTFNGQSTYLNNVFVGSSSGFTITFNAGTGTVGSNNVPRYPLSGGGPLAAFPSTSVTSYTAFDWYADYHLNPNVPLNVLNAGIFGGGAASAWKPGSVPFNPHWVALEAPGGTTTVNGTLQNVTIKATAQQD